MYWVTQVCNANSRDHGWVAKDDWRARKVVKESNSGAKKDRCNIDADFVEESSTQQLLYGVSAVDPNGLPGGGGFRLVHGAFETVGHEVDRRVGSRPAVGDVMRKHECWSPRVIPAPAWATSNVRRPVSTAPSSAQRLRRCSALGSDTLNVMGSDPPVWNATSPEFMYQSKTSPTPSLRSAT